MIIEKGQIFNLMDTNGRRSDVLNALKIYLEILAELKEEYPTENWGTYPASLSQFLFYERALEKSKDVFKIHGNYDAFIEGLGEDYGTFLARDRQWIKSNRDKIAKVLDKDIEKRARHYTSNLVKMGFTNPARKITEAGYAYLRGTVVRDALEDILPLDNVNIILLRQLLKLKVFGCPDNGKRTYYSPFVMALALLLGGENMDGHTFEMIVQGLSPYSSDEIKQAVSRNAVSAAGLEKLICDIDMQFPAELAGKNDVTYDVFKSIFKSSKSNETVTKIYFDFYCAVKNFRNHRTEETYADLLECLDGKNAASLSKAFGYGKGIFAAGNKGNRYNLERFMEKNENIRCWPGMIICGNFIMLMPVQSGLTA